MAKNSCLIAFALALPWFVLGGPLVLDQRVLNHHKFRRAQEEGDEVPGEFTVEYRENITSPKQFEAATNRLCAVISEFGGKCTDYMMDAITGFNIVGADSDCLLELMKQEEHDFVVFQAQRVTAFAVQTELMSLFWGLDRIDQKDYPLDLQYRYEFDGDGVEVYIADTGIRASHQEFNARSVECAHDAINEYGAACNDNHGHGTLVAGTACGEYLSGVAKNCILKTLKVLDSGGYGSTAGITAAINVVTARAKAKTGSSRKIINMSLGGNAGPEDAPMETAIQNARNAGVLVVVAAGNDDGDACNTSPARSRHALTVGATEEGDDRSCFSNYGSCVDIFAPGLLASPHVASIAALYWQHSPSSTRDEIVFSILADSFAVVGDRGAGSPNLLANTYYLNQRVGGGTGCVSTPWISSNGHVCDWYERNEQPGCPLHGQDTGTNGLRALQACCWCIGGSAYLAATLPEPSFRPSHSSKPSIQGCVDLVGWVDSYGDNCSWYELYDEEGCPLYGDTWPNGGVAAKDACCWCTVQPSSSPSIRPSISASPTFQPSTSSKPSIQPSKSAKPSLCVDTQPFSTLEQKQPLLIVGGSLLFTFSGLPDPVPASTVTIRTVVQADISSGASNYEFFVVREAEANITLGRSPPLGGTPELCHTYECCINTESFSISSEQFNDWKKDGDIVIELDASWQVHLTCSSSVGGSYGVVSLSYPIGCPSTQPSTSAPSVSARPSRSALPSSQPTISVVPSRSALPSGQPSLQPSITPKPSSCVETEIFSTPDQKQPLLVAGGSLLFTFSGLPDSVPLSTVTIRTVVQADLTTYQLGSNSFEFFVVREAEASVDLGRSPPQGEIPDSCYTYDCCINTESFSISAEQFNDWNQDGDIVIELDASPNVDLLCSSVGGSYGVVSLSYTIYCPSSQPSAVPSISAGPSTSASAQPSNQPSISTLPTSSLPSGQPSELPSVLHSFRPSISMQPSSQPSKSSAPSICVETQTYSTPEQQQPQLESGGSLLFTFTGLPDPVPSSTVTIRTVVQGDISLSSNSIEFFVVREAEQNVDLGRNPPLGGTPESCYTNDCCVNTESFTISAEQFNDWKQDGDIVIELDASNDVDLWCSSSVGGSYGVVSLSYTIYCPTSQPSGGPSITARPSMSFKPSFQPSLSSEPSVEVCVDLAGWVGPYGRGCWWYELYDEEGCPRYGDLWPSGGVSANDACCWCKIQSSAPSSQPSAVPSISARPSSSLQPTVQPSNCVDLVGWVDSHGTGCSWYEHHEREGCPIYGDLWPRGGVSANDACCWCSRYESSCVRTPFSTSVGWQQLDYGGSMLFNFAGLPDPLPRSTITIDTHISGDTFYGNFEVFIVRKVEEKLYLGQNPDPSTGFGYQDHCYRDWEGSNAVCCENIESIYISAEEFNYWKQDGDVVIELDASSGVGIYDCQGTYGHVYLRYDSLHCSSAMPSSSSRPSPNPSSSTRPSVVPSSNPSSSNGPSEMPSSSRRPSSNPSSSTRPSASSNLSSSNAPSALPRHTTSLPVTMPSTSSITPSASGQPSTQPSTSRPPSMRPSKSFRPTMRPSTEPSASSRPSTLPSTSSLPSKSSLPSAMPSASPKPSIKPSRQPRGSELTPAPLSIAPVTPIPAPALPNPGVVGTSAPVSLVTPAPRSPTQATSIPATTSAPFPRQASGAPVMPAPVALHVTPKPVTPVPVMPPSPAPAAPALSTPAPVFQPHTTRAPATHVPTMLAPTTPMPATPAPISQGPVAPGSDTPTPVEPAPATLAPLDPSSIAPATQASLATELDPVIITLETNGTILTASAVGGALGSYLYQVYNNAVDNLDRVELIQQTPTNQRRLESTYSFTFRVILHFTTPTSIDKAAVSLMGAGALADQTTVQESIQASLGSTVIVRAIQVLSSTPAPMALTTSPPTQEPSAQPSTTPPSPIAPSVVATPTVPPVATPVSPPVDTPVIVPPVVAPVVAPPSKHPIAPSISSSSSAPASQQPVQQSDSSFVPSLVPTFAPTASVIPTRSRIPLSAIPSRSSGPSIVPSSAPSSTSRPTVLDLCDNCKRVARRVRKSIAKGRKCLRKCKKLPTLKRKFYIPDPAADCPNLCVALEEKKFGAKRSCKRWTNLCG